MANTFIFDEDNQPENMGAPAPAPGEPSPEGGEGSNRTFMIFAFIFGGILLVALICMATYVIFILPGQRQAAQSANATNAASNTQAAIANQMTQEAAQFTATLPPTDTATPAPSDTPVLVFATDTTTSEPTIDPGTATVLALQTQLAEAQLTATFQPTVIGTPAALARTGFADQFGIPGLFLAALVLIAVILIARRLRQSPISHQ